jgi:FkbM family methyltransferase
MNFLSIGRLLGHAQLIPFGVRDRALRLMFPPGARRDYPFTVKLGKGLYSGNLDNYIDWMIFFFGQYERAILSLLATIIPRMGKQPVFWDVGANSGQHSIFAASLGARVESFEPFGPVRAKLLRNASLNPELAVTVHPFGLSDADREHLFVSPDNENLGTGHFSSSGNLSLPLRRGDDVDAAPPHIMKIDVEGHEGAVLRGLENTLKSARPIILCEFSERTKSLESDLQTLLPGEYALYSLTGVERPRIRPYNPLGQGEMLLFIPKEKESLLPNEL